MKEKIRNLHEGYWLREGGNRVRLTGEVDYPYLHDDSVAIVFHEMGAKYYETEDGTWAGNIEVEVELA